jgi:hypothetical protein
MILCCTYFKTRSEKQKVGPVAQFFWDCTHQNLQSSNSKMLFARGNSMAKSYADVLAERKEAAPIASSEDVSDTARLAAGNTPELVVVVMPPKKRRVRPGVSARKRKEAKKAKEIIAEVVHEEIVIEVDLDEDDSKELLGADAAQVEVRFFHGMLMWGGVLALLIFLFSPSSKSNTIFLLRSSSRYLLSPPSSVIIVTKQNKRRQAACRRRPCASSTRGRHRWMRSPKILSLASWGVLPSDSSWRMSTASSPPSTLDQASRTIVSI